MPCPVALAKETRNNIVDKRRSKRIAAIMLTVSDSDESNESSSSKDETSAMENSDGEQTKFMIVTVMCRIYDLVFWFSFSRRY